MSLHINRRTCDYSISVFIWYLSSIQVLAPILSCVFRQAKFTSTYAFDLQWTWFHFTMSLLFNACMCKLYAGLCYRICTIYREGTQFCTSFLDVCLLLFWVGDECASAICCFILTIGWTIANCASKLLRYKWNLSEVPLERRLDFFETNWAFFAGFGNIVFPL